MYLPHKAADNGTVGGTIATNPMREDDQRVLSFRLSNRSVLQHTWVLDLVTEMTLPSIFVCVRMQASKQAPIMQILSLNCVYWYSMHVAEHAKNSL